MPTYRDLSLPDKATVWRELRGLRVSPPGVAQQDKSRAATFQASLEQAQQFMTAAEGADYATRPLQLFYALSQGGRAIASASKLLPTSINIPDKNNPGNIAVKQIPWRLRGHGITAPGTSEQRAANITVKADSTGLFPGVALALGVDCLVPEEKIKLGDIWPLIPEASSVPLPNQGSIRAISLDSARFAPDSTNYHYSVLLGNISSSVQTNCGESATELRDFFLNYPTVKNFDTPTVNTGSRWNNKGNGRFSTEILWEPNTAPKGDPYQEAREKLATKYRGPADFWIFPKVGGMTSPLHPLLAWWATLFALSMMARYEPDNWTRMIRIDTSDDANAIEHLLDTALEVVPTILLEAIKSCS